MLSYSEPKEVDKIRSYISELFDYYEGDTIRIKSWDLNKILFNGRLSTKRVRELLTDYLSVKQDSKKRRYIMPVLERLDNFVNGEAVYKIYSLKCNGKPHVFYRKDFS